MCIKKSHSVLLFPIMLLLNVGFMAARKKASVLRRLFSYNLDSYCTPVTLLRLWIRDFTMIVSAWWLRIKSNFSGQEFDEIHRNFESAMLVIGVGRRVARNSKWEGLCLGSGGGAPSA